MGSWVFWWCCTQKCHWRCCHMMEVIVSYDILLNQTEANYQCHVYGRRLWNSWSSVCMWLGTSSWYQFGPLPIQGIPKAFEEQDVCGCNFGGILFQKYQENIRMQARPWQRDSFVTLNIGTLLDFPLILSKLNQIGIHPHPLVATFHDPSTKSLNSVSTDAAIKNEIKEWVLLMKKSETEHRHKTAGCSSTAWCI